MCDCDVCKLSRKVREKLELMPEDQRGFWEEFYDNFIHVEFDRDYYKSVIDGSWPNADNVIENARSRVQQKVVQ